ncbi:MAG: MFS transporter [Hyphomonadaceae bacterium]|nr:MFS transporter [Hyphomonadaceae bacterium]
MNRRQAQVMVETASPPAEAAAPKPALAALSLSMALSSLTTSIANVALPALTSVFDASFQEVQWIVLAYLLASTTLVVSAGRLGDIVGRKRLLIAGLCLFTTASLIAALAPNLAVLIAARALQGAGAAIMMTLAVALVGEAVPRERMGSAMGLMGAMSAAGTALGPSLGGVLLDLFGWRALFLVGAPLGAAALALTNVSLASDGRTRGGPPRFDLAGAMVLAAALGAYAFAMSAIHGDLATNICLLIAAAAGFGLFTFIETHAPAPLISLQIMRDGRLVAGICASAVVAAILMTTLVVGPFYLVQGLGLGAAAAGLAMSVGPVIAALVAAPAGRLVDRIGSQRAMRAGLAGITAGCALLALTAPFGVLGYLPSIGVLTASYALFQAANNTAVMACAQPDQRGVISALLSLSRNLGLLTGASAMGAAFSLAVGAAGAIGANAGSVVTATQITFAAAFCLALLALFIATPRRAQAAR